jgi:hypothetical protein
MQREPPAEQRDTSSKSLLLMNAAIDEAVGVVIFSPRDWAIRADSWLYI